jgi:hypothetical protein
MIFCLKNYVFYRAFCSFIIFVFQQMTLILLASFCVVLNPTSRERNTIRSLLPCLLVFNIRMFLYLLIRSGWLSKERVGTKGNRPKREEDKESYSELAEG